MWGGTRSITRKFDIASMKKKILHVSFGAIGNGGVSAVIMSIIRSLYSDYQFDVMTFSQRVKGHNAEVEQLGGHVYCVNCDRKGGWYDVIEFMTRPFRIFFYCLRLFKREKYDVIHCHYADEGGVILLAAKWCKIPIRIMHSHNAKSPLERKGAVALYRKFQLMLEIRYSNYKVGCSTEACEAMFGKRTSVVINNALDFKRFRYHVNVDSPLSSIHFVHVGRFTWQKNQLFLLDVFKYINQEIPTSILTLVGWGEDATEIKQKIDLLELEKKVQLLPANSNIPDIFSKSDYMIFPSRYEGLGIVLLEAQVSGVYCFASSVVPKVVDLGLCAFLALSLGAKGWADIIIKHIQKNKNYKLDMIKKNKFDIREVKREYIKLYGGEI